MTGNSCCKNCGAPLKGSYCHLCGEKRLTIQDRSVSHWFKDTLSQVTQLDGKVIRTIISMMANPARLSNNYQEGIRKPYLKMANLFLIANLLYFLIPGLQTFKTPLRIQANEQVYSVLVERIVDRYMSVTGESFETLEVVYDQKTTEVSKLLLILLVLLLGLSIYGVFFRQMYLSDAFNVALQFWSAYIIMFILPSSLLILIHSRLFSFGAISQVVFSEWFLSGGTLLFSAVYLWKTLSTFSRKWWHHLLRMSFIILSFFVIFTFYRLILFLVTMLVI